ncbi:hypothetical protein K2173_017938 [Erythroxylum novogranatense]|uniref:Uncharacterized protein n=1 Tax=Erythroxylum novogranatense TaxID=1862640 RepID=A0AAV8TU95_9ROSI|nr:hypothetical protein K2173_017938 [Erythroxylum novogranatense]
MGREVSNGSVNVIPSSIALLQERFRQLQKVKRMREERELLKMLGKEPKNMYVQAKRRESAGTRSLFQPELMIIQQPVSPPHVSLSLWPTLELPSKQTGLQFVESPTMVGSSPPKMAADKTNRHCDKLDDPVSDEIDTSLHL